MMSTATAKSSVEELRATLPFFLTTADICELLRLVGGDSLAKTRYWLRSRRVAFIRAGRGKIYRREDVIAALEAALERPVA